MHSSFFSKFTNLVLLRVQSPKGNFCNTWEAALRYKRLALPCKFFWARAEISPSSRSFCSCCYVTKPIVNLESSRWFLAFSKSTFVMSFTHLISSNVRNLLNSYISERLELHQVLSRYWDRVNCCIKRLRCVKVGRTDPLKTKRFQIWDPKKQLAAYEILLVTHLQS